MGSILYGVDLDSAVTPLIVRDAMIKCFYEAHCQDAGFESGTPEGYCDEIVKKSFEDSGDDFGNPTKDSLLRAVEGLVKFSKNFRDPKIIEKHRDQILQLIEKL